MSKTKFDKLRRYKKGDTGLVWTDDVTDVLLTYDKMPFTVVDTMICGIFPLDSYQLVKLQDSEGNIVPDKLKGCYVNACWLIEAPAD